MAFDTRAILTSGTFAHATRNSESWGRALLTRAWAFEISLLEVERDILCIEHGRDVLRLALTRDILEIEHERTGLRIT